MMLKEPPPATQLDSVTPSQRLLGFGQFGTVLNVGELLLVGGLCFGRLVSRSPLEPLLILNLLLLFYQLVRPAIQPYHKNLSPYSKRSYPIVPLLGLALVLAGSLPAVLNALNVGRSLEIWGRILAGMSLYLTIAHLLTTYNRAFYKVLGWGLSLWGVMVAAVGLVSVQWNTKLFNLELYKSLPRLSLIEGISANQIAGALVVVLPLPFMLAVITKSGWLRGAWLLVGVGLTLVVLLTQSRTSWVAAGAGLAFLTVIGLVGWFTRQNMRLYRRVISLTLGSLLGLGLFIFTLSSSFLLQWVGGRSQIWALNWQMAGQFPYTGLGLDNFARSVAFFYPYFLEGSGAASEMLYAAYSDHVFNIIAHNLFFQVWLDLGLAGLIGLCLWFGWLSWISWRFISTHPLNRITVPGYAFVVAAVIGLVRGQADTVLWTTRLDYAGWAILGAVAALPACYQSQTALPQVQPSPSLTRMVNRKLRWSISIGITVLLLGLLGLNWQGIAGSWQRNQANLALQNAVWQGNDLKTEPYINQPYAYLGQFYDSRTKTPDRATVLKAVAFYRQALEINPADTMAWQGLAMAQMWQDDYSTAHYAITEALKQAPADPYSLFTAGLIYYQQGDMLQAVAHWQNAPNAELFLIALGYRARQIDKNEVSAITFFEMSLKVRPTALAYEQLGEMAQSHQNWQVSLTYYQGASSLEPQNFVYWRQIGVSLLQLGRKTEAQAALAQAHRLNPTDQYTTQLLENARV